MPLTRREALLTGGLAAVGATAFPHATAARPGELEWRMDMVHHNPGEPPTQTAYNDPWTLAAHGHNAQVVNEFRPPHTAITFDGFDERIFPPGSDGRAWVEWNAGTIDERIRRIHDAGLRALYFTDIIMLPKRLVELYGAEILDGEGLVDLHRPLTQRVHRLMLAEVFDRFPGLDGLVVRTGETYLSNTPHHTGNNPITRGAESHLLLLDILRFEVCVARDKLLFYRTWSFDGFHTDPDYYLDVTDHVEPHPNLLFTIKHTEGDYWRTKSFNPTITIGRHPQVLEVQCQREYEGKGAHPNYIADGVLNGFEENAGDPGPKGLVDVRNHPNLRGIWTWSRGGGWRGPYIEHELWCDLNFTVLSRWARDTTQDETTIFDGCAQRLGLSSTDRTRFRELALASAAGVLRGHYSTVFDLGKLTWTRDQFLGGSDKDLAEDFQRLVDAGRVDAALAEKAEAESIWKRIDELAGQIHPADPETGEYLRVSSRYGLLLHRVIHHGWGAMLKGFEGDRTGDHDKPAIRAHIAAYDRAWQDFRDLAAKEPSCASLYVPQSFGERNPDGTYDEDPNHGMRQSVDKYREIAG